MRASRTEQHLGSGAGQAPQPSRASHRTAPNARCHDFGDMRAGPPYASTVASPGVTGCCDITMTHSQVLSVVGRRADFHAAFATLLAITST